MTRWPIPTACALAAVLGAGWTAIGVAGQPAPPQRPLTINGTGFRSDHAGHHVVSASGDPYAVGLHSGRLLTDLVARDSWHDGDAPELRPADRLELLGLSDSSVGLSSAPGDTPPRRDGAGDPRATGSATPVLAVSAERGAGGHAFVARNFDPPFATDPTPGPALLVIKPTDGFAFVSVAWPGLPGVVSGINEHGLAIAVEPGHPAGPESNGSALPLLARQTLEKARTVEDAIGRLSAQRVEPPWVIGLADPTGRAAILRADGLARHAAGSGLVAGVAGPAATEEPNPKRRRLIPALQRGRRLERIEHRLDPTIPIGPTELAAILRDRRSTDGHALPLGHPHAIDALVAQHSVIFDATAGRLWLCAGPFTLGGYRAYDVADLIAAETPTDLARGRTAGRDLPADELLDFAPQVVAARKAWSDAERALDEGDLDRAEGHLVLTASLADHPTSLHLRGRLARARGEQRWALDFFHQANKAPPGSPAQAEAIRDDMDGPAIAPARRAAPVRSPRAPARP